MKEPTPHQRKVLRFVARTLRERSYPPTYREICQAIGAASTNAASDALKGLERKGMITRVFRSSRTIALTDAGRAYLGVEAEKEQLG